LEFSGLFRSVVSIKKTANKKATNGSPWVAFLLGLKPI
jgi:hypothetical protein